MDAAHILDKNRQNTKSAYIMLLELIVPGVGGTTIRLCNNNEDLVWVGDGHSYTWTAFPFQIGEIKENPGELPKVDLKVCNINGDLEQHFDATNGGAGAAVNAFIVRSDALDLGPCWTGAFRVSLSSIDDFWVTLSLGLGQAFNSRRPLFMFKANHCDNRLGGVRCGYIGLETDCNGTFARCKELLNSARFRGCPAVGVGINQ